MGPQKIVFHSSYHLQARDRFIRFVSPLLKKFITNTSIKPYRVLDLGCGAGLYLREMLLYGAQPHLCMGIDASADEIKVAQQLSPKEMVYKCGDFTNITIPDNSFEVILLIGSLVYFNNDQIKALSEKLHRWITSDGFLVTSCFDNDMMSLKPGEEDRPLELAKDGIRSFNFSADELAQLLLPNFQNTARYPHLLGSARLESYKDFLQNPLFHSSLESMLDTGVIKPTVYLDIFQPVKD